MFRNSSGASVESEMVLGVGPAAFPVEGVDGGSISMLAVRVG
jgi:hypothetical protein